MVLVFPGHAQLFDEEYKLLLYYTTVHLNHNIKTVQFQFKTRHSLAGISRKSEIQKSGREITGVAGRSHKWPGDDTVAARGAIRVRGEWVGVRE